MRAFQSDWEALHVIELTPAVLARARSLIERHRRSGFDAIHLCSAPWIDSLDFACFDTRLRDAAAAEGLAVSPW
jgi:predicted nucleic acid-binding protein